MRIDAVNDQFTGRVKASVLGQLPNLSTETLEWLVKEHYQFSATNVDLLTMAMHSTAKLDNPAVATELLRNIGEESGHSPMYREAMRLIGTDVDQHVEFRPTTNFLNSLRQLAGPDPSRALGAFYATETAAIFEHQAYYEICREICERRGFAWQGSLIKKFHDIHLDEGVEQGHKDGLATFVDNPEPERAAPAWEPVGGGEPIDCAAVEQGAYDAIAAMELWWQALLAEVQRRSRGAVNAGG